MRGLCRSEIKVLKFDKRDRRKNTRYIFVQVLDARLKEGSILLIRVTSEIDIISLLPVDQNVPQRG
jgi:hypothetical protein